MPVDQERLRLRRDIEVMILRNGGTWEVIHDIIVTAVETGVVRNSSIPKPDAMREEAKMAIDTQASHCISAGKRISAAALPPMQRASTLNLSPAAPPLMQRDSTMNMSPAASPPMQRAATVNMAPAAPPSLQRSVTVNASPAARPLLQRSSISNLSQGAGPSVQRSAAVNKSPAARRIRRAQSIAARSASAPNLNATPLAHAAAEAARKDPCNDPKLEELVDDIAKKEKLLREGKPESYVHYLYKCMSMLINRTASLQ